MVLLGGCQNQRINEYFIEVPPEMKPLNYEKIEGGAYW